MMDQQVSRLARGGVANDVTPHEYKSNIAARNRQSLLGNSWHLGVVMLLLQAGSATIPTDGHILHEVALKLEVGGKALPRSLFLRNASPWPRQGCFEI